MRMVRWLAGVPILASVGLLPAQAASNVHFSHKPIIIAGSANVAASAINDSGTIAGTYTSGGTTQGFVLHGTSLVNLPPFCEGGVGLFCVAFPTAINKTGTVAGYWLDGNVMGFVWQNGAYLAGTEMGMGSEPYPAPQTPVLNNHGEIAFNYDEGDNQGFPYAGPPTAPTEVQGFQSQDFNYINNLNNHGTFAGHGLLVGAISEVFAGTSGNIKYFAVPGAEATFGGFINDFGELAGSYVTTKITEHGNPEAYHGFLHIGHTYTTFDMPGRVATELDVQAINNTGRVVGVYTRNDNVQRVFYFNGTDVYLFGKYPKTDAVHVALNDHGVILLSDAKSTTTASFLIHCHGGGC